jgi:alpha-beta hydrolase superfamily lysophospholipase
VQHLHQREAAPQVALLNYRRALVAIAVAAVAVLTIVGFVAIVGHGSSGVTPFNPTMGGERSVEFLGAGNRPTEASLLLPANTARSVPAVLIVPDGGAVDRNGPAPVGSPPDPLYADLAHALAAKGVASLRYDPRGSPTATGQSSLPPGTSLRFEDLVGDARAGLQFLASRSEINPRAIALVGDGWGGLVAMSAAAGPTAGAGSTGPSTGPSPAAVVLVSTPGRSVVDSLAAQLQAQAASPADGQQAVSQLQLAANDLAAGAAVPSPAQLPSVLKPILAPDQLPYLQTLFSLDPTTLARPLHLPALVVSGEHDPAVTSMDDQSLADAFPTPADVVVAAGASHTLLVAAATTPVSGPTTTNHYANMQGVLVGVGAAPVRDNATMGRIVDWLTSKLTASAPAALTP